MRSTQYLVPSTAAGISELAAGREYASSFGNRSSLARSIQYSVPSTAAGIAELAAGREYSSSFRSRGLQGRLDQSHVGSATKYSVLSTKYWNVISQPEAGR